MLVDTTSPIPDRPSSASAHRSIGHSSATGIQTMATSHPSDPSASATTVETEAGPSRPRRPVTPPPAHRDAPRPASPENTLPRATSTTLSDPEQSNRATEDQRMTPSPEPPHSSPSPSPAPAAAPRLDLATYPTPKLLRLLANLLQQIASANDQLRPDLDEYEDDDAEAGSKDGGQGGADSHDGANGHQNGNGSRRPPSATSSAAQSRASSTNRQPRPSPTTALFPSSSTSAASSPSVTITRPHSPRPTHPALVDTHLFSASKQSLHHPSSLLSFHARHVPSISIEAYLLRILKYCPTTNEVFLSLLVYFDRMSRLGTPAGIGGESVELGRGAGGGKGFAIDSFNVHRLVIAGVTVASKFFSDVFYTNSRYAKVGGLPPSELNQLELQFLLLNDFRLAIPIEEMQRYGDRLVAYSESRQVETEGEERADVEKGQSDERGRQRDRRASRDGRAGSAEQFGSTKATSPETPATTSVNHNAVVRGASEAVEADTDTIDPAQPPPQPSDTASAPSSPDDRSGEMVQPERASTGLTSTPRRPSVTRVSGASETDDVSGAKDGTRQQASSRGVSFARPEGARGGVRWGKAGEGVGVVSGTT